MAAEPNRILAGKRPQDLIGSDTGTRLVEQVLGRIEQPSGAGPWAASRSIGTDGMACTDSVPENATSGPIRCPLTSNFARLWVY
jgi:hypothetical protein